MCKGFLFLNDKRFFLLGVRPAVPTEFGEVQFNANFPPVPAAETGARKLTFLESVFIERPLFFNLFLPRGTLVVLPWHIMIVMMKNMYQ